MIACNAFPVTLEKISHADAQDSGVDKYDRDANFCLVCDNNLFSYMTVCQNVVS